LQEFVLALRNLGVDAPADELSILFDTFDTDHGGSISYKELNKQLRAGADADLSQITVKDKFGNIIDVNLAAGAAGAIESRAELIARGAAVSHEARRKKGSAFHGSERLVASQESGSVQTQLRDILKENAVRVIDLFRDWDDDQSGTITFKEFRRAIGALGYEAPPDDLRAVFDSFDNDKGGTIELSELNKHLRRGADILLDPALRDGAAGEIVLESKNLNRRSLPEQLAVALAAKADADPRAALRRTGCCSISGVARDCRSPRRNRRAPSSVPRCYSHTTTPPPRPPHAFLRRARRATSSRIRCSRRWSGMRGRRRRSASWAPAAGLKPPPWSQGSTLGSGCASGGSGSVPSRRASASSFSSSSARPQSSRGIRSTARFTADHRHLPTGSGPQVPHARPRGVRRVRQRERAAAMG
jgi:Ca2+-binding EF-hand superfamily protein